MSPAEAAQVMAVAIGGSVAREHSPETLLFWQSHLLPLPFEPVRRRVHQHVAAHKWVGSLAELLEACGLPESARRDVVRAVQEGGQVVPDLRSMTGWSYVAPGAELPRGALEAEAVARESLAPEPPRPRLPVPADPAEAAATLVARIRDLAGAKRLNPARTAPPREAVEAELAAADARFRVEAGGRS